MNNKKNNIDLEYLAYFLFLTIEDYNKLKNILNKYFYENTPFGKIADKNKIELFKKIYLKLNKEVKNEKKKI